MEAELPKLAARFSQIYLFTIGLEPQASPMLPLPENVTAYNCAQKTRISGRISDVLHGLPTLVQKPNLPSADWHEVGHSPAKRLFLGYFLSRVERHTEEISDYLRRLDFTAFDDICIYSYWFFVAAAVGANLCSVLKKEGLRAHFFSRAHSYDLYTYANRLSYLPCRTMLLEQAQAVYTCSEDGKKYLCARYPAFENKIHVSYLGTEGGEQTVGSEDGVFRILTCCRTIPLKRLNRLVDALLLLQNSGLRLSWTHIGDGPALAELREKAQALSLAEPITFTGALAHDNVLQFYRTHRVDLFINLSAREGLPVAVMEALSFGVPAAVTNVGGCSELISNGRNGFLIDRDFTDAALAKTLQSAVQTAPAMRQNAFDTWKTAFSAVENYREFIDSIEDGLADR